MSRKKSEEPIEKKDVKEIRAEIRSYIQNERDTILKKWMALKESVKAEDLRRTQFVDRKLKEDTKSLPLNVLKFIGTLKKSVRHTMRYKGGTPYSIIRSLFLYWDADKSGRISAEEMMCVMRSLGAKVTLEDCDEIVKYYSNNHMSGEMDYTELLQDILVGEPSVIAFVSQHDDEARDQKELRFEEVNDKFVKMPTIVIKFLEAVRTYLARTMRNEGGTPFQHLRALFQFYDYDYSNGLQASELATACRRRMQLAITQEQAKEIVDYYDRKGRGEMGSEKFIEDVCVDVKPILTFTDLTPRGIAIAKKSLDVNPFIPKPFAAPTNKVLEKFKQDVKIALINKVNKLGGSASSWIREAFVTWDPLYTRKISRWDHLQGAAKRLGVTINDDESKVLINCYDRFHTGEMHYQYLADEIMKEDPHFLMEGKVADKAFAPTSRCPPPVQQLLSALKNASDRFTSKSKGRLDARDILHGTCLRFDTNRSGKIDINGMKNVVRELRVTTSISDADYILAMKWFDMDGSQMINYNTMIRQIYGEDVVTETLVLPKLKDTASLSQLMLKSFSTADGIPHQGDTGTMSRLPTSGTFGVKSGTLEKNMQVVESQAVKLARFKAKKHKILSERVKVERKLASIEEQKKKIIEDFKARRNNK